MHDDLLFILHNIIVFFRYDYIFFSQVSQEITKVSIMSKTIFALSTPMAKSGVAIIRISGEKARQSLEEFSVNDVPKVRKAHFCRLICKKNQEPIDEVLLIYFQSPHSFTGEDIIEIHCHGSKAVIKRILGILAQIEDYRMAEPGEFAKRAFLAGKMDLTEAEGLADLIDAETKMQHRQAMRQMSGSLRNLYDHWRAELLKIMAFVEAHLDFPEEDIPEDIVEKVGLKIQDLKLQIKDHLQDAKIGERIREGIYVPIIGVPNAGKSTLINHLAKRDVAIVSQIEGTTRDVLEAHLEIAGLSVTLADTAGLRQTDNEIEFAGIKKAKEIIENSDIKIVLIEAHKFNGQFQELEEFIDENTILLINKIDLGDVEEIQFDGAIKISLKDKINLDLVIQRLENVLHDKFSNSEGPVISRLRHRQNLEKAFESLELFDVRKDLVLAAENLRHGALMIGQITGRIDVDEILGEIFSNFCIGK